MADITIDQVREKYPQYKDMSDQQLAEGLHKKFYSDMPVDDFNKKIGYSEKPVSSVAAPKEESFTDRVGRKFNETTDYLGKEITQPFRHVPELKKTISEIPETFKNSLGTADQWKNSSPALMYRSEFGNDAESAEARKKMIDKASGVWDSAGKAIRHPIDTTSAIGHGIGSAASDIYHQPEVAIPKFLGSTLSGTLREPETLAVPGVAKIAGNTLAPVARAAGRAGNMIGEGVNAVTSPITRPIKNKVGDLVGDLTGSKVAPAQKIAGESARDTLGTAQREQSRLSIAEEKNSRDMESVRIALQNNLEQHRANVPTTDDLGSNIRGVYNSAASVPGARIG